MLLSYKMKYIGVACDLISTNLLCIVIDIVQDFIPYRNINNINNINTTNNNQKNKIDNMNQDDCNENNENFGNMNKKSFQKNKSTHTSLIENLNRMNSKENLKLNILIPEKKKEEINGNTETNNNNKDNNGYNTGNTQNTQNKNLINNISYNNTPVKLPQTKPDQNDENDIFTPKSDNPNNINIKKVIPKRNNSNNINIIKKDINNNNNNNNDGNENMNNIKFTMAGRTYKQQQEIMDISTKKKYN